jgi:hypothetical protein
MGVLTKNSKWQYHKNQEAAVADSTGHQEEEDSDQAAAVADSTKEEEDSEEDLYRAKKQNTGSIILFAFPR